MDLQRTATQALLDGLAAYERRHGWKGNLPNIVAAGDDLKTYEHPDWDNAPGPGSYVHALVTEVLARIRAPSSSAASPPSSSPTTSSGPASKSPQEILTVGDIAYVKVIALAARCAARSRLKQDSGTAGRADGHR